MLGCVLGPKTRFGHLIPRNLRHQWHMIESGRLHRCHVKVWASGLGSRVQTGKLSVFLAAWRADMARAQLADLGSSRHSASDRGSFQKEIHLSTR